jgi:stearoyl-CoA desaturase (delta-9 desaturase)
VVPLAAENAQATHDDIIYPDSIPFLLTHAVCLAALWTGVTAQALLICVTLYVVRMFGVTAGYHRYFSHRSFRTSRVGQFLLAFLAQTSAQRGILWWAAKHRHHHRYSDTEHDIHSPARQGFWYAHVGWILARRNDTVDYADVPDLARYPELVWLDRLQYLPAALLAVGVWLVADWSGLVVGFFGSTVLLYHGTFMINSLAHVHGNQRYVTGDDSRNNWWLAIITLGEGWHNNHHAYQRSTRQGFRWYEYDPTYYALKAMSWLRLVWDLGEPPSDVVRNERPLGKAVLEKVAHQLAMSFPVERISAELHTAWADRQASLEELKRRLEEAKANARARFADFHLPHVPSLEEIRARAEEMYAHTPSRDELVARARELLLEAVSARVLAVGAA